MSSEEKKWSQDPAKAPQKWADFVERVSATHWLEPPGINSSAGERVFRAISLLNGMAKHVKYAHSRWTAFRVKSQPELLAVLSDINMPGMDGLHCWQRSNSAVQT